MEQNEQMPPMPQQQVDISEVPVPIEIYFQQASAGFEFVDEEKDKFYLTFTSPNGIRAKIFYDKRGWENTLAALQAKRTGIVIAK